MLLTPESRSLDVVEGEASGKAGGVAREAREADEACEAGEVERRKLWAVSVSTLGKAPSRLACTEVYTSSQHAHSITSNRKLLSVHQAT